MIIAILKFTEFQFPGERTFMIVGGEREGDIEKIMENIVYQQSKYVISMTPLVKRSDRKGIIHIGLREFLKNGF